MMLRQKGTLKYTLIILLTSSNKLLCIVRTDKQVVSTVTVLHLRGIYGAFLFVKTMGGAYSFTLKNCSICPNGHSMFVMICL